MNSSSNTLKFPHAATAARVSASTTPASTGWLPRFGAAAWRALERIGQSRARRELLLLADRWEATKPDLAAQLRAACHSAGAADLVADRSNAL